MTRPFDFDRALLFIEKNYLKNRCIVSKDIASILDAVEKYTELPLQRHRYRTGTEVATWIVPHSWDVKEAWIKNEKGEVIGSYADHPLFVAPYSAAIDKKVSKEELIAHLYTEPNRPDAFAYNHRLAFQPRLYLKEWCLSLPFEKIQRLSDGPFHVRIDTEVAEGEMEIGEILLEGKSPETFVLIANYCHPGQVNDSFSGLVLFLEVMRTLSQQKNLRYTYSLLILPETIGSSIYLGSRSYGSRKLKGGIFSENVGSGAEWFLKGTREGASYLDQASAELRRKFPFLKSAPFTALIGNDEHVLDSPQAKIPCLSLQKYPFAEYHTSHDDPSRLRREDLETAYQMVLQLVSILERDGVYEYVHPVPFWMSRFDLYADFYNHKNLYDQNKAILNRLDGRRTLLAIAQETGIPFESVAEYVGKMETHGLVRNVGGGL